MGDYRQAREAFETSLRSNAGNPDALNELAICLLELGEAPEARLRLREATRLDPENPKILSNLGVAALQITPVHYLFTPNEAEMFRFYAAIGEPPPVPGRAAPGPRRSHRPRSFGKRKLSF